MHTGFTYNTQQPHQGEAGGGIVGAIVELGHLIILPGLISVREESRSLGVQSTDGLGGGLKVKKQAETSFNWCSPWKHTNCWGNDNHMGVISKGESRETLLKTTALCSTTVARQMKLVTFVQSQMNIRWCFPSDRDQSFPTECFLEAVIQSPCSCSLSEKTNGLQWRSAY